MELPPPEALPQLLRQALAGEAQGPLQAVVAESLARGLRPFLVGGFVRDLLLGQPTPHDLDLVLPGDAIPVARALEEKPGWHVLVHGRFRTAALRAGAIGLDLATARRERYARPGALPSVEAPASLEEDLFRRDFTVNAMALSLAPDSFGRLHDPYGGRHDLAAGLLRVLHERSFKDDATRLWRACRYAARLGLRLETRTGRLARRDAGYIMSVGHDRVRHELERIFQEERPEKALALAQRYRLLVQIHPALTWDGWLSRRLAAARRTSGSPWFIPQGALPRTNLTEANLTSANLSSLYWGLWLYRLEASALGEVLRTLNIAGRRALPLEALPGVKRKVARLAQGSRPSALARRLDPFDPLSLQVAYLAQGPGARRRLLAHYLQEGRPTRPLLRGADLQALGVPAGPALGRILEALRDARLDKRVKTREDEAALVRRLVASGA
ncbi:MAG: CCA tRNA nucleotidyltransferase [Dehalococcoidia bacterium]|nr:CCA tRNA nucleotidyltransferase [Dehalococcoidia bacterium]